MMFHEDANWNWQTDSKTHRKITVEVLGDQLPFVTSSSVSGDSSSSSPPNLSNSLASSISTPSSPSLSSDLL